MRWKSFSVQKVEGLISLTISPQKPQCDFVHGISSAWPFLLQMLPTNSCVTLGKSLNFSVSPHVQNG